MKKCFQCFQCFQCFHSENKAQLVCVMHTPENPFFFENDENIGKVLSGTKNYFRGPKIIFGKKPIFGLTEQDTQFVEVLVLTVPYSVESTNTRLYIPSV
jgi:hypothetical protein